jgi:hypothetical protein
MVPKRALDEVLILYKSNKLLLNLFSFQALNLSAILCSWGCLPQITKGQHSGGQLQLSVDSLVPLSCRRMIIGCPTYKSCLLVSYSCLSWRKHYLQVASVLFLLMKPLFWSMLLTFQHIPLCSFL